MLYCELINDNRVNFMQNTAVMTEIIARMTALGLTDDAISAYREKQKIPVFYGGKTCSVADFPKYMKTIRKMESESLTVFGVIVSELQSNQVVSYLYVNDFAQEEWALQRSEIQSGIVMTYTENTNCPELSEYGSIGISTQNGYISRMS